MIPKLLEHFKQISAEEEKLMNSSSDILSFYAEKPMLDIGHAPCNEPSIMLTTSKSIEAKFSSTERFQSDLSGLRSALRRLSACTTAKAKGRRSLA